MRGYPGTGKSTIARLLAAALHAPLIDRDIIRKVAVDVVGNLPRVGHFAYELMFALTREQLGLGLSVVVDAPLTYRTTREQAQELAHTLHTRCWHLIASVPQKCRAADSRATTRRLH